MATNSLGRIEFGNAANRENVLTNEEANVLLEPFEKPR